MDLRAGVLVSYLDQKNGFEFTTYLGYDINTENTETSYQSEQVFHIDATVAQHLPLDKGLIGSARTVFTCSNPPETAAVVPGAGFSHRDRARVGPGKPKFTKEQEKEMVEQKLKQLEQQQQQTPPPKK